MYGFLGNVGLHDEANLEHTLCMYILNTFASCLLHVCFLV